MRTLRQERPSTFCKEILELASNAKKLWLSRNPRERVEFLKKLLWNPRITGSPIEYELRKPFAVLSKMRDSGEWGLFQVWRPSIVPPHQFTDFIEYPITPLYLNQNFLHQKYIAERLSCEEIAKQIASARSTVLKFLKHYQIPIRASGANIRRRNLQYGIKLRTRARKSTRKRRSQESEEVSCRYF